MLLSIPFTQIHLPRICVLQRVSRCVLPAALLFTLYFPFIYLSFVLPWMSHNSTQVSVLIGNLSANTANGIRPWYSPTVFTHCFAHGFDRCRPCAFHAVINRQYAYTRRPCITPTRPLAWCLTRPCTHQSVSIIYSDP